jgi:cytochrome c553
MSVRLFAMIAAAAATSVSVSAVAADLEKAGQKAEQICAACHGKNGNAPIDPSYPRLAGQHEDYIAHALISYRKEWRKNAIMIGQAKQLSDEDIDGLAKYFARMPGQLQQRR